MSRARNRSKLPENRRCRVDPTHAGPISKRELCLPCAIDRQTFAAVELNQRSGPTWDAWLAATTKALSELQRGQ